MEQSNSQLRSYLTVICFFYIYLFQPIWTHGQDWTLANIPSNHWVSVAISTNGSSMVAAASGAGIYRSTNAGRSWLLTSAPTGNWSAIVSSADGNHLAASLNGGGIWFSTDGGKVWSLTGAPTTNWHTMAVSGNGAMWAGVAHGSNYGTGWIYFSTNSGNSWTLSAAPSQHWQALAASFDGSRWIAASDYRPGTKEGFVYTSTNFGVTWVSNSAPDKNWSSVASSTDGTHLVVVPVGDANGNRVIYNSINGGGTWISNSAPTLRWTSVASSADGVKLLAGAQSRIPLGGFQPLPGPIYSSRDTGLSWSITDAPSNHWSSVAVSADGSVGLAVATNGPVYLWRERPRMTIASSNGTFVVSWPFSSASADVVLQQSATLPGTNWINSSLVLSDDGTTKRAYLDLSSSNLFFRLKQQ